MNRTPTIVRIWRGRTRRDRADEYEAYNYEAGITPLIEKARGVQTLREHREHESEFVTISYWENVDAMTRLTGGDPTAVHHLDCDAEFLIELPTAVQVLQLRTVHGYTGHSREARDPVSPVSLLYQVGTASRRVSLNRVR